jgi:surfeit locus 1 family protein
MAAVMLLILIGLGTWQVYRLQWKERIMARIAEAERAPPVPLPPDPQPYTKIEVTGHFRFGLAVQYGAEVRDTAAGPTMGTYQIVPLERDGAHWFSPVDDLATRQFYTLDDDAIATAIGLAKPMPFTMIALGPPSSTVYPVPAQTLPRPPNNHLSYAITWYGLAVALIVIFIVWARKPSLS